MDFIDPGFPCKAFGFTRIIHYAAYGSGRQGMRGFPAPGKGHRAPAEGLATLLHHLLFRYFGYTK